MIMERLFLPQLIQSAEAVKISFEYYKRKFIKTK